MCKQARQVQATEQNEANQAGCRVGGQRGRLTADLSHSRSSAAKTIGDVPAMLDQRFYIVWISAKHNLRPSKNEMIYLFIVIEIGSSLWDGVSANLEGRLFQTIVTYFDCSMGTNHVVKARNNDGRC